MKCYFCEEEITELPFKCKFCQEFFCSKHRLPEKHDCEELKSYHTINSRKYFKKVVYGENSQKINSVATSYTESKNSNHKDHVDMNKLRELRKKEKSNNSLFEKIKRFFKKYKR